MDDRSGRGPGEARQRWRIVFGRDPDPSPDARPESVEAWVGALSAAGLPIAASQAKSPRPRVMLAMPLPPGVAGEAEVVDVVLTDRLTLTEVRTRIAGHLPDGDRLIDLFDVWLGEPPPATRLVAADYRVDVRTAATAALARACEELLAADSLPRSRARGDGRVVDYDLRPLVVGAQVVAPEVVAPEVGAADVTAQPARSGRATIRMRLRISLDAASGRPDEVILALADALGQAVPVDRVVRERLLTDDTAARV